MLFERFFFSKVLSSWPLDSLFLESSPLPFLSDALSEPLSDSLSDFLNLFKLFPDNRDVEINANSINPDEISEKGDTGMLDYLAILITYSHTLIFNSCRLCSEFSEQYCLLCWYH